MKFDEENVQEEIAEALDIDPDDLDVEKSHLSDFDVDAFSVTIAGGDNKEWIVVEDDDAAEQLAIAVVTQDLEQEPELFNQSFIESHIDMKALKSWVYDAQMEDDYAYEIAQSEPDRFWEEAERWGVDVPEEDEDGDMPEDVDDEYVEALKEAIAEERAKDPMGFLEDIYGNEATKYAIEAVGIDIKAAAEDAIATDGWQHFLAHYDGESHETGSGFVYWRVN